MKKSEERALEAYPVCMVRRRYDGIARSDDPYDSNLHERYVYQRGYEQAEKDLLDKAAEWWYQHIVGFMNDGLAKAVAEEFRAAMEE